MKNLLIVLLLSAYTLNAQVETDKLNHLGAGYLAGFVGNGGTYKLLTEFTSIKTNHCKWLSFAAGLGTSILAGHLKEVHDMNSDSFYSKKDLQYTGLGGLLGSLSVTIIIGRSVPESKIPKTEIFDVEYFPLVKK